jgi:hypothetical protein
MMPSYPEKALFAGRHFMFALPGCRAKWHGVERRTPCFCGSSGPCRSLMIRESANKSSNDLALAE